MDSAAPKIVFIIPYRNRKNHLSLFQRQMKYVLEDIDPVDYKIIYAHQCDTRAFNRGAMKNIGFLAMKNKYPHDYQSMTFVFNDVDTMPYNKNTFDYKTISGVIKHYYGFRFALGGIVSITGFDFEKINGFPNFWAWGYEDNELQRRAELAGINIDRSQFYNIEHENIIQIYHGKNRIVNRAEAEKYKYRTLAGLDVVKLMVYELDESTGFLNITNFDVGSEENKQLTRVFDLTTSVAPFQTRPLKNNILDINKTDVKNTIIVESNIMPTKPRTLKKMVF